MSSLSWKPLDIEDLHKIGTAKHYCPYYLERERAGEADIIFMPYNYLVDENLRKTFQIDFKNSIMIIDEAHNIREVAEDVSTFEMSED